MLAEILLAPRPHLLPLNATWHKAHRMPKNPTLQQRMDGMRRTRSSGRADRYREDEGADKQTSVGDGSAHSCARYSVSPHAMTISSGWPGSLVLRAVTTGRDRWHHRRFVCFPYGHGTRSWLTRNSWTSSRRSKSILRHPRTSSASLLTRYQAR